MSYQFGNWFAFAAAWIAAGLIFGIPVGIAIRRMNGSSAPEPTEFTEPRKTIIKADFVEVEKNG